MLLNVSRSSWAKKIKKSLSRAFVPCNGFSFSSRQFFVVPRTGQCYFTARWVWASFIRRHGALVAIPTRRDDNGCGSRGRGWVVVSSEPPHPRGYLLLALCATFNLINLRIISDTLPWRSSRKKFPAPRRRYELLRFFISWSKIKMIVEKNWYCKKLDKSKSFRMACKKKLLWPQGIVRNGVHIRAGKLQKDREVLPFY